LHFSSHFQFKVNLSEENDVGTSADWSLAEADEKNDSVKIELQIPFVFVTDFRGFLQFAFLLRNPN
jgi:hypothetical protein